MKKIFLIYGHYNDKSFNAAIRDTFIKTAEEKLVEYSHDETEDLSYPPEVVLKPKTSDEIADILKYCNAEGVIPARKTAETASQAFSAEEKGTSIVISFVGKGINLNTILVMIPRVPSLPIIRAVKS